MQYPTNYRGLANVKTVISALSKGFVAILEDGTVDSWGKNRLNNNFPQPSFTLTGIKHVYANGGALVAIKNDGTIAHAWGDTNNGGCAANGDCSSSMTGPPIIKLNGRKILNVVSTSGAFLLQLNDTEVIGFGRLEYGGNPPQGIKCKSVIGASSAAACIKLDGTLTAWPEKDPNDGHAQNYGGDVTHFAPPEKVTMIKSPGAFSYPLEQHFIALTKDRRAIAWGQDPSSTLPKSFTIAYRSLEFIVLQKDKKTKQGCTTIFRGGFRCCSIFCSQESEYDMERVIVVVLVVV
eukprot:g596.t1